MTSTKTTQTLLALTLAGALQAAAPTARAEATPAQTEADIARTVGFVPTFFKAIPGNAAAGTWEEVKRFELSDKTALGSKTKDLIGLAIAAQVPSRLTAWSYARCARAGGATDAEVREAVMMSALARHWSTFFNGMQLDEGKFRAEIVKLRDNVSKAMASGAQPPPPVTITDARSVLEDAEQTFGFVPDFLKRFPPEALPGAWLNFRNVELNPASALPGKIKSLIGLAVSSQIPCRYCVIADTEFAKLEGATDREISEAVAMAGVARQHITLVEGLQVDEKVYRRDWERLTAPRKTAARPAGAGKTSSVAKAE